MRIEWNPFAQNNITGSPPSGKSQSSVLMARTYSNEAFEHQIKEEGRKGERRGITFGFYTKDSGIC